MSNSLKKTSQYFILSISLFLMIPKTFAAERIVNLIVAYKTVNFAGKFRKAIAVNNTIPAPTLHFKEGDRVQINVYNHLDKETSIHWHGILLPWQMDGVVGVSQRGIKPGSVFQYHFTFHQAGTYWYHAHAGLQEQLGLYGALIIDPQKPSQYQFTRDYVVVLSDWSNTEPNQILANLKKDGDYYSPRFPLQPSLVKFLHDYCQASMHERQQLIGDYKMMQQMRMSIYDISDVAYDAFLLNGKPKSMPWTAPVKVGDRVRLRFIGAGASTIFHVKLHDTTVRIVNVQGNDVQPYAVNDFTIAPGETYDVLVNIQNENPYIIYAESLDTVGAVYGALVNTFHPWVNYQKVVPFPQPLPVSRGMMSMMNKMKMPPHQDSLPTSMQASSHNHAMQGHAMHHGISVKPNMNHSMSMPTEPSRVGDKISPPNSFYKTSPGTKYQPVIAAVKTNNPNKPISGVIQMELFGYMDRFIWFINGVPEDKAPPIVLDPGKRYRFIFTNTSMMHHPMHIHGHWFIFRKGSQAYDPLLHTIDVAPGATITADMDTDASGQWIFHCHLLYHMMSGMARIFQYSTLIEIIKHEIQPQQVVEQTPYVNRPIVRVDEVRPIDASMVQHPMPHVHGLWLATFLDVSADPFNNVQRLTYKGLYGTDYNKLELLTDDAELNHGKTENADMDIFYWNLINQFWAVKAGVNYFYRPSTVPYWQVGMGIEGLMPYFIDTDIRTYFYNGCLKLDAALSRDTQITNNFFIRMGVRGILASKTIAKVELGSGLNQMRYTIRPYYRLLPGLNIYAEYEHEQDYGAFKNFETNSGESAVQDTLSLGLSVLF